MTHFRHEPSRNPALQRAAAGAGGDGGHALHGARPRTPLVMSLGLARTKKNGRRPARNRRPQMVPVVAYFRLATAVRSNLPVTTNVALHQLEPSPVGLIGVKSPVNRAVWSLVNALQSPLFRLLS